MNRFPPRHELRKCISGGRVVLGSRSPRRRELLQKMDIDCRIAFPSFDEGPLLRQLEALPRRLLRSRRIRISRALKSIVFRKYQSITAGPDELVLCFDTVITHRGRVLGKPGDRSHAAAMLHSLSGRSHRVVTTCLAALGNRVRIAQYHTAIRMRSLNPEEVQHYLDKEDVLDAAGAYKIQGMGLSLIASTRGDYHNVVGLPLPFIQELRS